MKQCRIAEPQQTLLGSVNQREIHTSLYGKSMVDISMPRILFTSSQPVNRSISHLFFPFVLATLKDMPSTCLPATHEVLLSQLIAHHSPCTDKIEYGRLWVSKTWCPSSIHRDTFVQSLSAQPPLHRSRRRVEPSPRNGRNHSKARTRR